MKLYKSAAVRKAVPGAKEKSLSTWILRGLVKPAERATGSGTRNLFDLVTVCQIAVFISVKNAFLSREDAANFAFSDEVRKRFERIDNPPKEDDEKARKILKEKYNENPRNALLFGSWENPRAQALQFVVAFIHNHWSGKIEWSFIEDKDDYLDLLDSIISKRETHFLSLWEIYWNTKDRLDREEE